VGTHGDGLVRLRGVFGKSNSDIEYVWLHGGFWDGYWVRGDKLHWVQQICKSYNKWRSYYLLEPYPGACGICGQPMSCHS